MTGQNKIHISTASHRNTLQFDVTHCNTRDRSVQDSFLNPKYILFPVPNTLSSTFFRSLHFLRGSCYLSPQLFLAVARYISLSLSFAFALAFALYTALSVAVLLPILLCLMQFFWFRHTIPRRVSSIGVLFHRSSWLGSAEIPRRKETASTRPSAQPVCNGPLPS